jgi:hypothetical protein
MRSLVNVVEASVVRPVTVRLDEFKFVVEALLARRLVIVEVPSVAFVAVKLSKNAEKADSKVAKNEVVVAFVTVRVVIVVVASVEVPAIANVPEAARLPSASTANFTFSVQAPPFQ